MKKCYQCGSSKIETSVSGTHHYKECGLDDVYLVGIKQHRCKKCGEVFTEFPMVKRIHRLIGERLCQKDNVLSGKEVTFLRKEMRKNGKEFAMMLRTSASHLSRIEHDQKELSGTLDMLVRVLYSIYVREGEEVCIGTLDQVAARKPSKHKESRKMEFTPSDWMMGGIGCAT